MQPNLNIPLYIVAPGERRDKVVKEVNRPTFARLSPFHWCYRAERNRGQQEVEPDRGADVLMHGWFEVGVQDGPPQL